MLAEDLTALYHERAATKSDINEHFSDLAFLASQCSNVVEFGTRAGNSTVALLQGLRRRRESEAHHNDSVRLETVDVDPNAAAHVAGLLDPDGTGYVAGVAFQASVADTLKIEIQQPVDMIFFDTLHTYQQLKQELIRHGNKAKKFLVFHDTTTFGEHGEDGEAPGLWQAIQEFMTHCPWWKIKLSKANNNGLTVLERVTQAEVPTQRTPMKHALNVTDDRTLDDLAQEALDAHLGAGGSYSITRSGKATEVKIAFKVSDQDFAYVAGSEQGLASALGKLLTTLRAHKAGLEAILSRFEP